MTEFLGGLLILGFVLAAVMAVAGAWVAAQKGRVPVEGALLGFFLGPIGVLIVAFLPTIDEYSRDTAHGLDFDDGGLDDLPPIAVGLNPRAAHTSDGVRLGIVVDEGLDGRVRTPRARVDDEDVAVRRLLRELEGTG